MDGTLPGYFSREDTRVLPASLAGESREAFLLSHSTSSPDCRAVLFGLARRSSPSANNNNHNNIKVIKCRLQQSYQTSDSRHNKNKTKF